MDLLTLAGDASGPEEAGKTAAAAQVVSHLPEIRLVVVGWRWPGKSLTANTIIGKEEFHLEMRSWDFSVPPSVS